MIDGFDDPKVVVISAFRTPVDMRSEENKFEDAWRAQNKQNGLNEDVARLEGVEGLEDYGLLSQTVDLRDDIMKMFREKLADVGLVSDHPNYWVISQALEEMIEVGLRRADLETAQDMMGLDFFEEVSNPFIWPSLLDYIDDRGNDGE